MFSKNKKCAENIKMREIKNKSKFKVEQYKE